MSMETELKALIVDALMLEDVKAEDIDSEAALFGDGLGLDSIDALELSMAIHKKFGVRIRADEDDTQTIFQNVKNLAAHIESKQ